MKRFTIGITTHNEEATIAALLTALATFDADEIDVILYDDCSTDRTKDIVLGHPIARQSNFRSHFAETNNGTPSVGRTYIGESAKTEYVALLDGDDFVDVGAFRELVRAAPSGHDLILTPYLLRGKLISLKGDAGPLEVDNNSIMRILSGIGGKVYRSALLAEFGPDPVKGRSDDARLNMRIILNGKRKLFQFPDICFYVIDDSRKSMRAATLNFDELESRVARYIELQKLYPIDRRYLAALKRNIIRVINDDETVPSVEKVGLLVHVDRIFKFEIRRIIFIVNNLTDIGGIPQRVRNTLNSSRGRYVEYYAYCISDTGRIKNAFSEHKFKSEIIDNLDSYSGCDTVFITANNTLNKFSDPVKKRISRFPVLYMCSAQLSFMVQDSRALSDLEYVRNFRVSKIISFSDVDINFQRQLGIHGQIKGFLPVELREKNTFDPARNRHPGYVGRIDFHAKGCERLVSVARAMKKAGLPPIKLFTTEGENSPDYNRLIEMIEMEGLADQFDITLECTDKDIIYDQISMLLLPSKKESFGNVILEAYSYGIPVIGTSYAPGPSELIEHGRTGYLLDDFSGEAVTELFLKTDERQLAALSDAAFRKHGDYSMDAHFDFLEKVATDVINSFNGQNTLPVFPELKMVQHLHPSKPSASEVRIAPVKTTPPPPGGWTSKIKAVRNNAQLRTMEAEIQRLEKRRA